MRVYISRGGALGASLRPFAHFCNALLDVAYVRDDSVWIPHLWRLLLPMLGDDNFFAELFDCLTVLQNRLLGSFLGSALTLVASSFA